MKQNRRTYWGSFGAFVLGWLLTTASVLATLEEPEASLAIRSMATYGFVIVIGMIIVWAVVSVARWLEGFAYEYAARQLDRGIPAAVHALGWGVVILIAVAPFGVSVAWVTRPFGMNYWETACIVTLVLFLLTVSAAFVLGPAERRRRMTHTILSESVAAEAIAAYTPGEEATLVRLHRLEELITERFDALRTHSESCATTVAPTRFYIWGEWWRARPRGRRDRPEGSPTGR